MLSTSQGCRIGVNRCQGCEGSSSTWHRTSRNWHALTHTSAYTSAQVTPPKWSRGEHPQSAQAAVWEASHVAEICASDKAQTSP